MTGIASFLRSGYKELRTTHVCRSSHLFKVYLYALNKTYQTLLIAQTFHFFLNTNKHLLLNLIKMQKQNRPQQENNFTAPASVGCRFSSPAFLNCVTAKLVVLKEPT